ncbi:hypothetical protein YUYDRAFT_04614 [Streptomyces sp. ScaeMP-e48]|uniref:Uncharacterized protein n=2 Tax=Streptomyces TaxID=1883 RepID=N0CSQ1_STRMI|nr:hypothetical protein SFUL_1635 [Streptomyces microflavus DSM 40593]SCK38186.1 hypothetical protein YUYDRAFT_04614 [Streptomyces sp. ScaeMP-e48]
MHCLRRYVSLATVLAPQDSPQEAFTMAKNKNRKQGSQHDRASESERGSEQAKSTSFESQTQPQSQSQGSPSDVARKHQRRFGHN